MTTQTPWVGCHIITQPIQLKIIKPRFKHLRNIWLHLKHLILGFSLHFIRVRGRNQRKFSVNEWNCENRLIEITLWKSVNDIAFNTTWYNYFVSTFINLTQVCLIFSSVDKGLWRTSEDDFFFLKTTRNYTKIDFRYVHPHHPRTVWVCLKTSMTPYFLFLNKQFKI